MDFKCDKCRCKLPVSFYVDYIGKTTFYHCNKCHDKHVKQQKDQKKKSKNSP